MPDNGTITVFGGTGFLGQRVVQHLADAGSTVRVAVRHIGDAGVARRSENVLVIPADVTDAQSTMRAIEGATALVNCVSLYHEHGAATFQAVHVEGAENVARAATRCGINRVVHISGIGSNAASSSNYIAARGAGEESVREMFEAATVVRPSVMFAENDGFLGKIESILRSSPVVPLFGNGDTRLQPVHVGDVANGITKILSRSSTSGKIFEFGGPDIVTYRRLLERVRAHTKSRALFMPMPFTAWRILARLSSHLPQPPITMGQVDLMRHDNVADPACDGLGELEITPQSVEDTLALENAPTA